MVYKRCAPVINIVRQFITIGASIAQCERNNAEEEKKRLALTWPTKTSVLRTDK